MITIGLLIFPLSTLTTTCETSTDYLYLMAREDNIVPTIRGGDIVRVKFRAGGNLMNAGDVMVFFNVVARDPLPEAM